VRNSAGQESDWVLFEYPFDWDALEKELQRCELQGKALRDSGQHDAADEPLRRAYVFLDRMYGAADPRTRALHDLREMNLDDALRARLRFTTGTRVKVIGGKHTGAKGAIQDIWLRYHQAYQILTDEGQRISAADDEVEPNNEQIV
jgi:hypothetical protein